MSKSGKCIEMLQLLNTGRLFKISELSDLLETNPRNVLEYKKELEDVGYSIKSVPGKYGGYQLIKTNLTPALQLTNSEKEALTRGFAYLSERNDFPDKEEFQKAYSKVVWSIVGKNEEDEPFIINRFPLRMSQDKINEIIDTLRAAIKAHHCVKFKYVSRKNIEKEHIAEPYEIFMYNNAWFFIGWLRGKNDVAYFKINRITDINITDERYVRWASYKRSDYIDEFGFKFGEKEWEHIEFKATGIYASLVKERIYGKNQEVIPIDDETTLVKVDMRGKSEILTFILGFGKDLELLEPQWLKDELIEYADFVYKAYKTL